MEALNFQQSEQWPEYFDEYLVFEELWIRGDLEFLLWEQQIPIWEKLQSLPSDIAEFVVLCARQFGKSVLGVLYALSEAIKNRDCCILIMGPDINQTVDIVGPRMRWLCRTAPPGLIKPMGSRNRYHVYHDRNPDALDYTEIIIGGFNENSSSQRGKTVHLILVEEIVDVPEDHFITSIRSDLGPAMLHSKNGRIVYFTTPPKYPDHPFITETLVNAYLNDAVSTFTIDDNIALDDAQKAKAIALSGGPHSIDTRREYYCEVKTDPRIACTPDFDEQTAVRIFGLPLMSFMCVTIDWGGIRDKTCAVLHTYDYLNNKDLFWDCRVFEPNTSTIVILDDVRKMMEGHNVQHVFIDTIPDRIREFNNERNFPCTQAYNREPIAQANQLNVKFQQGQVWIHPRCKFLIVSARSGTWNDKKTDFARTAALGHMDGIASMMYAVQMVPRWSPYEAGMSSLDALQMNQMPARSDDTSLIAEPVIIPKSFGRYR